AHRDTKAVLRITGFISRLAGQRIRTGIQRGAAVVIKDSPVGLVYVEVAKATTTAKTARTAEAAGTTAHHNDHWSVGSLELPAASGLVAHFGNPVLNLTGIKGGLFAASHGAGDRDRLGSGFSGQTGIGKSGVGGRRRVRSGRARGSGSIPGSQREPLHS